ncbi:MAG TPA: glycoside hydrolase family 36 protein [Streptosporangiaceae bacterium]
MNPLASEAAVRPADHERIRAWTDHLLDEAGQLPVSFHYDGTPVRGIPPEWSPTARLRVAGPAALEKVYEGRDPDTGLGIRVEVVRYQDFPVVEWTAWLTNHSAEPTPIVQDLLALDADFAGDRPTVQHSNGDFYSGDGYAWVATPLDRRTPLELAPSGGRPCDRAFPYFRLAFAGPAGGGLTLAVGWPGQWATRFSSGVDGVTIQAGQEQTSLRLRPGETIRTPRITLMGWDGNPDRAVNLWRRWYREHVMPRPAGSRLRPLLSAAGTDEGEEFTGATEANQLEYQRRFAAQGVQFDAWWLDAGWYPCRNAEGARRWTITGTWQADPERFPDGLAPVGQGAAALGARFLLWFEPERVAPGTELWEQHPDWVLKRPGAPHDDESAAPPARSGLLDLSNDECRIWLTELVSGLITEYGVGVYRQDFNFPPLEFWRMNDTDDRQGATENLHVQGYLAFWDALLDRHPGLLIDSCASGGRRNDLETMRRSVPLHYTDYGYGEHAVKLDFHRTMYEWLLYFRESTQSWDLAEAQNAGLDAAENDSFAFHCALAPMLTPSYDIKSPVSNLGPIHQMIGIWRRAAELVVEGDYYPLSPAGRSGHDWVAAQFNRPPDLAGRGAPDGFIQAIRLAHCDQPALKVVPRGLRMDATYLLENPETGQQREVKGASLAQDGLVFDLPPRSGSIWFYTERN